MTALQFSCPHCSHGFDDPYEVLDDNKLLDIRCDACGKHFSLAIMECHRCAREEPFTWAVQPPPGALPQLTCACGATFVVPESLEDGDH